MPVPMTTLQVVAVQNLTGRAHEHVRVFGHVPEDPERTIVEVPLYSHDAVEIIEIAAREKAFPEIEVPSRSIVRILTTDGIDVIHMGNAGEDPRNPGPHGKTS